MDVNTAGKGLTRVVNGQVTDIWYPNGKSRAFEYDNGRLTGYTADDGSLWKSADGLHWKRPDTGTQITGVMHTRRQAVGTVVRCQRPRSCKRPLQFALAQESRHWTEQVLAIARALYDLIGFYRAFPE